MVKNIFLIGEPVDNKGPLKGKKHYPIHRDAPPFLEQRS